MTPLSDHPQNTINIQKIFRNSLATTYCIIALASTDFHDEVNSNSDKLYNELHNHALWSIYSHIIKKQT